ncbi:MAG: branched-chain amino acid ABC transporter permease [Syntrophomonadaceae bacterium]|jgi:branched-chain amino acid transport system permease protein|nr:branched-chain amino acid ABC transporter permease [Bacillota bacterium]NLM89085.1 branched-chain amino acid ABC transporter permease [Syntrophomonadaceae bacterium]HAA10115.1 branched-chain amino acid ABC transporter permease [Syntrophomonas sp.]HQA50253.1 branched-chain amino acid ABC transporter permease [Syntrophomonadaceae bacterium]HQD91065.1 branched-chain amino acid ABC transporter permease [Syntrophomonadaceae bacterium]
MQKTQHFKPVQFIIEVGILVVIFTLVQYLISAGLLNQYYQINLASICINIILAVSLNLINGFTGQLSLGHAGFMAVGAYASVIMTTYMELPFIVGIIAACLAAALAGFIIGVPTLRLRGDYLAIATLGFGEIIRVVLQNIDYVNGPAGIMGISKLSTWPWLFGSVVITILVIVNLVNSSYGRAIISVREDEVAAELMGVNTTKYKVLAFVVGAMFAGLAGALYAHYFYIIKPETFNFMKSFDILVMVVLGGLGSTTGAIIAAIFITVLTAALQSFPAIRMILYAVILVTVMIYRPQGLMGNRELGRRTFGRLWGDKK